MVVVPDVFTAFDDEKYVVQEWMVMKATLLDL